MVSRGNSRAMAKMLSSGIMLISAGKRPMRRALPLWVRNQPSFFPERPAATGGRVIDEHQGRVEGVKKNHRHLAEPGNEIDEEGGDGHSDAEKGDLQTLEDIAEDSGQGKSGIASKISPACSLSAAALRKA